MLLRVLSILRNFQSDDSVSLNSPILFVYTDGGPDYRTIYWSVKLAHIATFIVGDLDMRIAARTAPSQSICNPAEMHEFALFSFTEYIPEKEYNGCQH